VRSSRDGTGRQAVRLQRLLAVALIAAAWLTLPKGASADLVRGDDVPLTHFVYDIAATDFDGDGSTDLALTTHHSVAILKGHGDGFFTQAGRYLVGAEPSRFAVVDLNRDGKKDIVTANFSSDNVSVLIGRGDGTFKRRVNYRAGDGPIAVAVGRLNRGRRPDLALANINGGDVSVLLGKGHGDFRRRRDYRVGGTPRSVAFADLNGDHRRDLAVTKLEQIAILKGRGDGTFRRGRGIAMEQATLWDLIAGDFNRDGTADLGVNSVNYDASQGIHVLLGHGNGSFTHSHQYAFDSAATKVRAAKVTVDGRRDLVVATEGYPGGFGSQVGYLYVMRGQRDGTFTNYFAQALDGQGGGFAVADLNGDGKRDVAAITYTSSPKIEIFLNE
jgi:hypothetical protein